MNTHILVVDDEKELADVLELYLVSDGYTVHKCYTGAEAMDCMEHTDLDLAILDVMLPDADGFQLCKKLREKSYCPIITGILCGATARAPTTSIFIQPVKATALSCGRRFRTPYRYMNC